MLIYRLLADAILVTHVVFILFVLVGQGLILVGLAMKWGWVRNMTFRLTHLAAICFVVGQTWLGEDCPLTVWENGLRIRAGQDPYADGGFIADWLHRLFFFEAQPWVFNLCYSLFGLTVLLTFVLAPPRKRRGKQVTNPTPSP